MKKKKNKNLNQVRKVIKRYKEEDNSPTDRIEKTFKKHSKNYKENMERSWERNEVYTSKEIS